ncbi:hypothetical protein OAH16_00685 [bacterium]|nr:hypothetical protein [bacterium]
MKRFKLDIGSWYAMEYFCENFNHVSPILVEGLRVFNSRNRSLKLSFFHANYSQGVQDKRYGLQTVIRNTFMLVAERQDEDAENKRPVLCFFELTPEWLETHFRGSFRSNSRYDAQEMMFEEYPILKKR